MISKRIIALSLIITILIFGLAGCNYFIGNKDPVASFDMTFKAGTDPQEVKFDAADSEDPDGDIVSYDWNLGSVQTSGKVVSDTFDPGNYNIELTVTDDEGATGSETQELKVD